LIRVTNNCITSKQASKQASNNGINPKERIMTLVRNIFCVGCVLVLIHLQIRNLHHASNVLISTTVTVENDEMQHHVPFVRKSHNNDNTRNEMTVTTDAVSAIQSTRQLVKTKRVSRLPKERIVSHPVLEPTSQRFHQSSSMSPNLTEINNIKKSTLVTSFLQSTSTSTATQATVSKQEEQPKMLPTVIGNKTNNSNGGGIIIFYLHIPKTGGTTQMAPFVSHPDWMYRMVYGQSKQERYRKELYQILASRQQQPQQQQQPLRIYYEYHAGTASPYMMPGGIRDDLKQWKQMAKEQNISSFALTVLRNPLDFAISHFNFYHAGNKPNKRFTHRPKATLQDFLLEVLPNPQCLFCHQGETAYEKQPQSEHQNRNKFNMSQQQCEDVYNAFMEDMDWIGTTETLSTETFPILERIGRIRYCPERRNPSHSKFKKRHLTPQALEYVRTITSYDQSIYDRIRRTFTVEMWQHWWNETALPLPPPGKQNKKNKKPCKYKTGQALPPGELPKREGARRRFLSNPPPDFVPLPHMIRQYKLWYSEALGRWMEPNNINNNTIYNQYINTNAIANNNSNNNKNNTAATKTITDNDEGDDIRAEEGEEEEQQQAEEEFLHDT